LEDHPTELPELLNNHSKNDHANSGRNWRNIFLERRGRVLGRREYRLPV